MLRKTFQSRQFIYFVVVGGYAAVINFIARILYNHYMSYEWAVFYAYLTGMITAFLLSRYFVFEGAGGSKFAQFYRFTLVNILAVIQVWGISVGLARYVFPALKFQFYADEVAHIIGLSIPVFTSFLGHKYFSFRKA